MSQRNQQITKTLLSSESNEWYTPLAIVEAARLVLGGTIDLDPASCEFANQTVKATRYFSIADNGLALAWLARSLFINPPYGKTGNRSNQELWFSKLRQEYRAGNVKMAIAVLKAVPGEVWQQNILAEGWPVCLTENIAFTPSPEMLAQRKAEGKAKPGKAKHGNAIFYLGPNRAEFESVFSQFGNVVSFSRVARPACPVCSRQFQPKRWGGTTRKYCGPACKQKAYRVTVGRVERNTTSGLIR